MTSSPLYPLWRSGVLSKSAHLVAHVADILRFLLLRRYGGTYLDLDLVVVGGFPKGAQNFIGLEDKDFVGEGG